MRAAAPAPAAPIARWIIAIGASLLTLASIAWALQLYRSVGLLLMNEQLLACFLGLGVALVYLTTSRTGQSPRQAGVPWYDWCLAAAGLAVGAYLAVHFPRLSEEVTARPTDGLVCAFIALPLLVEALRRVAGRSLTIVILVFLVYALVGDQVPGQLAGRPVKMTQLAYYLVWDPGSMLGAPMGIACTVVIAFIFFGTILFASGGSAFFTDISLALMGRYRGGSAKIAVTASSLFGTISGSAVSNVTSTGVITIPLMQQRRLSSPRRRRHRGGGVDRRPADAAGDGCRRVPDGGVPAGSLQGRGARRPAASDPLLLRAVRSGRPARRSPRHHPRAGGPDPAIALRAGQGLALHRAVRGADLCAVLAQLVGGEIRACGGCHPGPVRTDARL